jgi:hypothetical protein
MATDGVFSPAESDRLHLFVNSRSFPVWRNGSTYKRMMTDPEFLQHVHKANGCAWIKGDGTVLVEVQGHDPKERLHG